MKKKYGLIFLISIVIFLSGCGDKMTSESLNMGSEEISLGSNTSIIDAFVVGQESSEIQTLYGIVVVNTIQTVQSKIGGDLEYIDCQPGAEVFPSTIIAKITPNLERNVNIENSLIQKTYLEQQIDTIDDTISRTEDNFDIQEEMLEKQKEASEETLDDLRDKQKKSSGDFSSQIDSVKLSIKLFDDQLDSLENTKEIQLTNLRNQKNTLLQNLAVLDNTIQNSYEGENVKANVYGVIKAKLANKGNTINPNTPLCQIIPFENDALKIQIYSPFQIPLGRVVALVDSENSILGTGVIAYELPNKDIITQNYTYEITNISLPLHEGDKIIVKLKMPLEKNGLWVPIDFVVAQLDGNFVKQRIGNTIVSKKVILGDINGGNIEVISGLVKGDIVVR